MPQTKSVIKLNWFQLTMLCTIVLIICRTCYFSKREIVGTYTSNAVEAIGEIPRFGEKLTLYENGTYQSVIWGEGEYRIDWNELQLFSVHSSAHLPLQRKYVIGVPRILLNDDLQYYLIKD